MRHGDCAHVCRAGSVWQDLAQHLVPTNGKQKQGLDVDRGLSIQVLLHFCTEIFIIIKHTYLVPGIYDDVFTAGNPKIKNL